MTWKVVAATNHDQLAKQLTALTAAGFTIFTVLALDHAFTIVAYTERQP